MRITEHPFLRWLLPGIKIKRYLVSIAAGIIMLIYGIGIIYFQNMSSSKARFLKQLSLMNIASKIPFGNIVITVVALVILFFSVALIVLGLRELVISISSALVPDKTRSEIMNLVFEKRKEDLKKRIVVIGGGTGTSTVLRGLKYEFVKVSAVITIADSGGSSGRLRREMGILPPGDIRNCLTALAEDGSLAAKILDFRFKEKDSCLNGHSMGNLLVAALTRIKGDFGDAVISLGKLLGINGEVMPFTTENTSLVAEFEDGTVIEGESEITSYRGKIRKLMIKPDNAKPYMKALKRIHDADVIVIGPGSLYTSVIPPLLLPAINDTIVRSKATKIFICNIMTEPGETDNFAASDHLKVILSVLGGGSIDYVLLNTGRISDYLLKKYAASGAVPVKADIENLKKLGVKCIAKNFVSERGETVRHNSIKLAKEILSVARRNR